MVTFPSEHNVPAAPPQGKRPRGGNWGRRLAARVGALMRRRVPERRDGSMGGGRLGEVYLRRRVDGAAELVVESPGYRQVICEATPAMENRFAAMMRGEQSAR